MRNECGQEQKEGIYAVSLTENLGIGLLEECCRKIVLIPDEVCLVEARKFESELNCFCTIPKFSQQLELIESGTKYELVFEKVNLLDLTVNQTKPLINFRSRKVIQNIEMPVNRNQVSIRRFS